MRPRQLLRYALIALSLAGLAYLWVDTGGQLLTASTWSIPFVLEILVVSLPWRTVSLRSVFTCFAVGFGPLFVATIVAQQLLADSPIDGILRAMASPLMGEVVDARLQLIAPLTEELAKLVPLLVLLVWPWPGLRRLGGPLDLAVIGGATGAGMGFAEDIFRVAGQNWTWPETPFFGLGVGGVYMRLVGAPVGADGFTVTGILQTLTAAFEPERDTAILWAGHGTIPMLTGLALGLALVGTRRIGYLLPVAAFIWGVVEHVTVNSYDSSTCDASTSAICGFAAVDSGGRLYAIAVLVTWLVAVVVSHRILRAYRDTDPQLYFRPWPLRLRSYRALLDVLTFFRLRRRSAFAALRLGRLGDREARRLGAVVLATRTKALLVAGNALGLNAPQLKERERSLLARLASTL